MDLITKQYKFNCESEGVVLERYKDFWLLAFGSIKNKRRARSMAAIAGHSIVYK